jgi:GTP cyclohydrolase II
MSMPDGVTPPWTVLVPQKALSRAKSRLELPDRQRRALAVAMLRDLLATLAATGAVAEVLMLWDDPRDAAVLQAEDQPRPWLPVTRMSAAGLSLNEALTRAAAMARGNGAGAIAVLPGDLPALTATDLELCLARAAAHPRAFLPDAAGSGTTVLTALAGQPLDPRYGPASTVAHVISGAHLLDPDGLDRVRADVDDLAALRRALALGCGPCTSAAAVPLGLDATTGDGGSDRGASGAPGVAVRARVPVPVTVAGRRVPAELCTFTGLADAREHLVLSFAGPHRHGSPPRAGDVPLVRVHSECLTGDVFGSRRCDCGSQLQDSLGVLAAHGGHLVYLRQEGRGIGLYAKLDAYLLQDGGLDTFAANRALGHPEDARDYTVAAAMLGALGIDRVDLLTGNPEKAVALADAGTRVRDVLPLRRHQTPENAAYLAAKEARGHLFATQVLAGLPVVS